MYTKVYPICNKQFEAVNTTISEVDKIKVNLLGIKAQIEKFVK